MVGLDRAWLDTNYEELLDKSSVVKEDWIKDQLENYWCWPTEWREAYDQHRVLLNTPVGSKTVVLFCGSLTLYEDERCDYFFQNKYYRHGALTKADKNSAKEYITNFKEYKIDLSQYKEASNQLAYNLNLLKDSLGEGL